MLKDVEPVMAIWSSSPIIYFAHPRSFALLRVISLRVDTHSLHISLKYRDGEHVLQENGLAKP